MSRYSLIVDYKYCTGCHACEIACNQEYDRPVGISGIKVFESAYRVGEKLFLDYLPVRTDFCSFCAGCINKGKAPSCVQHCLSGCLQVIKARDLDAVINGQGRMMLFT